MQLRRGVLANSVMLVVAGVAERAGSLLVALILSRAAGADGLGAYVTVIAYYQLLTVAAEVGVSNYLVREISTELGSTGRWLTHAVLLAVAASGAMTGAALLVVPHLGLEPDVRTGTYVVLVGVLPAALNVVARAVFVAHQLVVFDAAANVVASVVLVVSGWFLIDGGRGVLALVVAYVLTRVGITIWSFAVIHGRIAPLRAGFDPAFARSMLRGLRPFAGSTLVGALFARPELLMLSVLASSTQVGNFGAAFKTVDLWQLLPETYMLNAYPVLARTHGEDPARASALQRDATTALLAVGLPVAAGLWLTADDVISLLFGPELDGAVPLLRAMAVLVVVFCVHTVLWRSLSARGEQSRVLRIQVPTLVLRLVVGAALIARFGALGAALNVPICLSIHNVFLARALRGGGPGIVDLHDVWPYAAATAAMAAAVLAVDPDTLLGSVAVAVPAYVVAAGAFRRLASPVRPVLSLVLPEREPT